MRVTESRTYRTVVLGVSALLALMVAAGIAVRGFLEPPPTPASVVAFTGLAQPGLAVVMANQIGRAFVSYGSRVSLVDTTTARLLHTTTVPGEPLTLAVDTPRAQVFAVPFAASIVSVLDARTGYLVRTLTLPLHPTHIAFDDTAGLAVLSGYNAASTTQVVAIVNLATGSVLHTVNLGATTSGATGSAAVAVDQHTQHAFVVTAQGVEMLDARTGARLHHASIMAGGPDALIIAASSRHVLVTLQGTSPTARPCFGERCPMVGSGMAALDTRTGHIVYRVSVGSSLCAPTVDDRANRVFVADGCYSDHSPSLVYTLDPRRGTVVGVANVSASPYALAVDPQRGRVVMVGKGGADVLDAQSGVRLTAIPWPGNAVTIDEHTGQAVVVSTFDYQWTRNKIADALIGFVRSSSTNIGLTHHVFGGVSIVQTSG